MQVLQRPFPARQQLLNWQQDIGFVGKTFLPSLKLGPSVQFGLSPEKMISNGALADFFRVLTTTPDQNGKIYVSSVEARNYPIYGTQWHPGKSAS
jgi:hypothetical protein